MPVTVCLPLHFHVLLILLSLWAECSWLFVPWKIFGWGVMSWSYFTSCASKNADFRQTRTRQKMTKKSRKHLLRRASSTWKTRQLVKLTWQVDLSHCPFSNHLTSYNLSSQPTKSTSQIIISAQCRTLMYLYNMILYVHIYIYM